MTPTVLLSVAKLRHNFTFKPHFVARILMRFLSNALSRLWRRLRLKNIIKPSFSTNFLEISPMYYCVCLVNQLVYTVLNIVDL